MKEKGCIPKRDMIYIGIYTVAKSHNCAKASKNCRTFNLLAGVLGYRVWAHIGSKALSCVLQEGTRYSGSILE